MLEIKNLYLKYNNAQKPSIEDISFAVEKGDRIAILGPSGCGKTSLLRIIAGLLNEKEAKIEGVLDWRSNKRKPTIRMVFQEATLLPWRSVENNVAFGLEAKRVTKDEINRRVSEVLDIVGLSENSKQLPMQLSIGMQQRVNFARALVCEPDLLLMDEPFSALDLQTKKKLQESFLQILKKKKITCIFVTHNMQEAIHMATKIIVLSKRPTKITDIIGNGVIKIEDEFFIEIDE